MGEGSVPFSWSPVIGLSEFDASWHAVHPSGGEEDLKHTNKSLKSPSKYTSSLILYFTPFTVKQTILHGVHSGTYYIL